MDACLASRRPEDRAREQGVLVLPVVPVDFRLHGVDALRRKTLLDVAERDHAPLAVILHGHHRVFARFNEHVAARPVLIKRAADVSFGQKLKRQPVGDEMFLAQFPLSFRHGVLVDFRVAALRDRVVRHADQRRDVPETRVRFHFVALERVSLHVADERMQEDETSALLHAFENRVARRARHARPAVEAGNDHHLEGRIARQVFFDVAVNDLKVVAVATVLMPVVVANAPAVGVPVAVNRNGGRLQREALHQLYHVAAILDRRNEEPFDGAARKPCRPLDVGRDDLGRIGDVVFVKRAPADSGLLPVTGHS